MANVRFLVDITKVAIEVKQVTTGLVTKEMERVARLVLQDQEMSNLLRSQIMELKQMVALCASSSTPLDPFLAKLTKISGHNNAETLNLPNTVI